ncbi:MAG: leucyl aminopeptidase family protein, partial [Dehalococcoidia bacterium]
MKFEVKTGDISKTKCDAIIVNLFEGTARPGGATAAVDVALGGAINGLIKNGEFKGKANEVHVLHALGKVPARLVVIAGLGKKEDFKADKVRSVMAEVIRALARHNCDSAATILHGVGSGGLSAEKAAEAIAEGSMLGAYKFKKHFTKKDNGHDVNNVILLDKDVSNLKAARRGTEIGEIIAEAAMLARDMVNEPGNHMTPSTMAEIAKGIAEECGLDIVIMDRKQMEKEAMGALLGVAQGTSEPPKFIVLSYKGNPGAKDTIAFVGKGLTFDSGGISLKPQEFMSEMKGDMSGGAAVIAAIKAVAKLKLKINLTAIVPATENLPGGRALKPGDVLKASNGKTIEVVNTDAEGRLILSDALSYAV